jgi:hypothetical protein
MRSFTPWGEKDLIYRFDSAICINSMDPIFGRPLVSLLTKISRVLILKFAHTFGILLKDQRTGEPLGRVLVIPFRGKLWIVGLSTSVRPEFLPQIRTTYWKQDLGFSTHPDPDFPFVQRSDLARDHPDPGPDD